MKAIRIKGIDIGGGRPKLAVSLTGESEEEIREEIKLIDLEKVDLVEWRADFFKDILNPDKLLATLKSLRSLLRNTPIIFTIRTRLEGGQVELSIEEYSLLNERVARAQLVDLIDIEVFSKGDMEDLVKYIKGKSILVIGSHHNFLKTPSEEEMMIILKEIDAGGFDILKLAVMPENNSDLVNLLNITNKMKKITEKPIITISMGKIGIISRVSGRIFGSSITFGALGKESAPGQIPVDKLFDILEG